MKFNNIRNLLDKWVYSVETINGDKTIHIDGYCYWNDESYQLVQGTFCYISLDDVYDMDKIEEAFGEVKQYQCEITEQEVFDYYCRNKRLPMNCVCHDTPDGTYTDC